MIADDCPRCELRYNCFFGMYECYINGSGYISYSFGKGQPLRPAVHKTVKKMVHKLDCMYIHQRDRQTPKQLRTKSHWRDVIEAMIEKSEGVAKVSGL